MKQTENTYYDKRKKKGLFWRKISYEIFAHKTFYGFLSNTLFSLHPSK